MNGLHLRFEGSSVLSESAPKSAPALHLSASMPVAMLGCAKGFLHKVNIYLLLHLYVNLGFHQL